MIQRQFWLTRIEEAWERRSVVWLSGVRRSGKTVLCQTLENVEYFDCELPRVRRRMADPEGFLAGLGGRRVALDEVQRLPNPSELLKIAADHFPDVKVLATGSSTLHASAKFKDTLTGRKVDVWLTPMNEADRTDFGDPDLDRRLLRGGLPPFFLGDASPGGDYQEWMDSYWAKDIQELFRLEKRSSFLRFAELLMMRSGGIFEATKYAAPCEISRTSVSSYLAVLEATRVAHVIRPFSTHRPTEIVAAPKVYAFDTGFVCGWRGWEELRPEDRGIPWEHYVLNELHAHGLDREVRYWRDKKGHEVDFVVVRPGRAPIAVECKWSSGEADRLAGLAAFRRAYPEGANIVVASDVDQPYQMKTGGVEVQAVGLRDLVVAVTGHQRPR